MAVEHQLPPPVHQRRLNDPVVRRARVRLEDGRQGQLRRRATGFPRKAIELIQQPLPPVSLSTWAGLLFLGVIASALAYLVYGFALRELDASLVGVYTNLDPIVGVLIAVLFFGETLHSGQIAGGLIAFAGMWLASSDQ